MSLEIRLSLNLQFILEKNHTFQHMSFFFKKKSINYFTRHFLLNGLDEDKKKHVKQMSSWSL